MASSRRPKDSKPPAIAQPSATVILISPENQVLMLHRVRTSSAFPSAHVFPGGNLDAAHDGNIPGLDDPARHRDSEVYRIGAIRETFEESGILLAKNNGFGRLIEVDEAEKERGRRDVHSGKVKFLTWLAGKGGRPDTDGLIPFTRWITPVVMPKRFSTQMYIYFLPLPTQSARADNQSTSTSIMSSEEALIAKPTHDGGVEHTAARFLPASEWLAKAASGDVILFPPQVYLLSLIAPFLSTPSSTNSSASPDLDELKKQRQALRDFLKEGDPTWGEMCISPRPLPKFTDDGRSANALDYPGLEVKGMGRRGDAARIVLVQFKPEGPRRVEMRLRKDFVALEQKGDEPSGQSDRAERKGRL